MNKKKERTDIYGFPMEYVKSIHNVELLDDIVYDSLIETIQANSRKIFSGKTDIYEFVSFLESLDMLNELGGGYSIDRLSAKDETYQKFVSGIMFQFMIVADDFMGHTYNYSKIKEIGEILTEHEECFECLNAAASAYFYSVIHSSSFFKISFSKEIEEIFPENYISPNLVLPVVSALPAIGCIGSSFENEVMQVCSAIFDGDCHNMIISIEGNDYTIPIVLANATKEQIEDMEFIVGQLLLFLSVIYTEDVYINITKESVLKVNGEKTSFNYAFTYSDGLDCDIANISFDQEGKHWVSIKKAYLQELNEEFLTKNPTFSENIICKEYDIINH